MRDSSTSGWRVLLRVLRHPIATLVFLALLWYLAKQDVARFSDRDPGAAMLSSGAPDYAPALIIPNGPGNFRVVSPDDVMAAPFAVGSVSYGYRRREGSGMGSIRETRGIIITANFASEDHLKQIESKYLDYLASRPGAHLKEISQLLRESPNGIARNTRLRPIFIARAVTFILLIHSLVWVIPVGLAIRKRIVEGTFRPLTAEEKRWRSLSMSRCPSCGYDIRSLPHMKCPECGETWLPMELTAWKRRLKRR